MNQHPHFTKKVTQPSGDEYYEVMVKYKNGEFRIVAYDLKIGSQIITGYTKDNRPIFSPIKEIKEQHVSAGEFKNYDRPNSYRVAV